MDAPVDIEIREAAEEIVRALTPEQTEILRLKAADIADAEIATKPGSPGRPSPTARKRSSHSSVTHESYSDEDRDDVDSAITTIASGGEAQ